MTEKKENDFGSLAQNLQKLEREGIRLYLDGTLASSESIAQSCINEETMYMPDYITDKEGKIKEIRYDKISFD